MPPLALRPVLPVPSRQQDIAAAGPKEPDISVLSEDLRIIHHFGDLIGRDESLRRELVDDLVSNWRPRVVEAKIVSLLQHLNDAGPVTVTRGDHFASEAHIS